LTVPLDKSGGRRTDTYNQVRFLSGVQRSEVFDKRVFWVVVTRSCRDQRVFMNVEGPGRLPLEFQSNRLRIFAPRLEVAAKGVKHQHRLRLGREGWRSCYEGNPKQRGNNCGGKLADVPERHRCTTSARFEDSSTERPPWEAAHRARVKEARNSRARERCDAVCFEIVSADVSELAASQSWASR
jgi:hypothetical protein